MSLYYPHLIDRACPPALKGPQEHACRHPRVHALRLVGAGFSSTSHVDPCIVSYLGLIEDQLEDGKRGRHERAAVILFAMVGALALSRMNSDAELSNEFIESTQRHLLRLAPSV